jgi:hypothetical protein
MNRPLIWSMTLAMIACGGNEGPATTDDTGPTSPDSGEEVACAILDDGLYEVLGSCFGHTMTVDLAMDDSACSFTLDDWSMVMGQIPSGGTVAGDEVTLSGWSLEGCVGTADGGTLSGVCDGGCAWEFTYED